MTCSDTVPAPPPELTGYQRRVQHWASRILRAALPYGYHSESEWPPALADALHDPCERTAARLELVVQTWLWSGRVPCSLTLARLDRAPAPPAAHDAGPGDTITTEAPCLAR